MYFIIAQCADFIMSSVKPFSGSGAISCYYGDSTFSLFCLTKAPQVHYPHSLGWLLSEICFEVHLGCLVVLVDILVIWWPLEARFWPYCLCIVRGSSGLFPFLAILWYPVIWWLVKHAVRYVPMLWNFSEMSQKDFVLCIEA